MMSRLDDLFLNRRNRFRSVFQGTLVAVLLVLFLIAAKSHKHESVWTAGELVVCADPTVWAALEDPLRKTFEHTIRTPQPETIFRIHRVEPDEFPRYRSSRYLVLLTTEEHRETFDFPQSDQLFMESETGFPMSRR